MNFIGTRMIKMDKNGYALVLKSQYVADFTDFESIQNRSQEDLHYVVNKTFGIPSIW